MKKYAVQMFANGHWETVFIAKDHAEAQRYRQYITEYVSRIQVCCR